MGHYDLLDSLILAAISNENNPLYEETVRSEARRLKDTLGRLEYRILDGRIQHLRKQGKIKYCITSQKGPRKWLLA